MHFLCFFYLIPTNLELYILYQFFQRVILKTVMEIFNQRVTGEDSSLLKTMIKVFKKKKRKDNLKDREKSKEKTSKISITRKRDGKLVNVN